MTRTVRLVGSVVGAVIVLGAGGVYAQKNDHAAARAAIEKANRKFLDGAAKNDAALIASVYTEDAIAFPANAEALRGRAAIQAMWKSVLDSGITGFELNTAEVESSGDLAYETGTYSMQMKDGTVADRGKYVVVWKRVNGNWLLHRDIWTTSVPAKQ